MEKIIGNYLFQTSFPWDCETLAYLATNQEMAEKIGRLAGSSFIIEAPTAQKDGYVYLRKADGTGEVLRIVAGTVTDKVHVVQESINVSAGDMSYNQAYTKRRLEWGFGSEQYNWADFASLDHIANSVLKSRIDTLAAQVALIQGDPVGVIKMWPSTNLPANYLMCDGGTIPAGDEYNALRTLLGSNNTPDLRGRFVVGYNANDGANDSNANTNYTHIGNTGGERKHQLTVEEMPGHRHIWVGDDMLSGLDGNCPTVDSGKLRYDATSTANITGDTGGHRYWTSESGGGQAHENRPPYYVLAYIIKAK